MRDRDDLLAELDEITRRLDEVETLRRRRVEIVTALRSGPEPMLVKDIAERIGVTSGSISQMTAAGKG